MADHMNDFFGKPLFQPTGTGWIDHAFTAAVLDDMEREKRARHSFEFATPKSTIETPETSDTPDIEDCPSELFAFGERSLLFEEFLEQRLEIVQSLSEYHSFAFCLSLDNDCCGVSPLLDGSPNGTLFVYASDESQDLFHVLSMIIKDLLIYEDSEAKIQYCGRSEPDDDGWSSDTYIVAIDG